MSGPDAYAALGDGDLQRASRGGATAAPWRSRSRRQKAARVLAIALIVAGAIALIDGGVTLVWQEPFSALYARLRQDDLSGAHVGLAHPPGRPRIDRVNGRGVQHCVAARHGFLHRPRLGHVTQHGFDAGHP